MFFFFFKQKTAYEMRISDWSSDVCSSDLHRDRHVLETLLALLRRDDDRAVVGRRIGKGVLRRGRYGPERGARAKAHQRGAAQRANKIGRASCRARVCQYV